MKLLCNVVTHTRRLLMRSEVNSRILCNCTVEPRIQLSVISSNRKQQCWIAYDYCETKSGTYECMQRTFGFKVATIEEAECFKTYFEEAIKDTARLLEYPVEEQSVVAEDEQTSSASQVMANSTDTTALITSTTRLAAGKGTESRISESEVEATETKKPSIRKSPIIHEQMTSIELVSIVLIQLITFLIILFKCFVLMLFA